jgi:hypothetical protein
VKASGSRSMKFAWLDWWKLTSLTAVSSIGKVGGSAEAAPGYSSSRICW